MKSMYCPYCKSPYIRSSSKRTKLSKAMTCLECHRSFSLSKGRESVKTLLLVLGIFVCISPLLLTLSVKVLSLILPNDNTATATSIVILGRGPDDRLGRSLAAAELFHEHRINIFVSGMSDAPVILGHLAEMGVPEKYLAGERCSQSTWENALFSDMLVGGKDKETIILITDEPHLLRAHLVFKGFGFDIIPYGVPREQGRLLSPKQAWVNLREHIALIAYAGNRKLWPKDEKERKENAYHARQKITNWGCSL